jgi:hypothetical protein
MKDIMKIDRKNLDFSTSVKEAFAFLQDFGYIIQHEDETLVQYTGQFGVIAVYHGRSSYEIGVEFSRGGNAETYSLGLLIKLSESSSEFQKPVATTRELVQRSLLSQAELFRKYGDRIFSGDSNIWKQLKELGIRNSSDMEIRSNLRSARIAAEKAFKERRYKDVVSYLSKVETWLTPAEKKKLSYARDHS